MLDADLKAQLKSYLERLTRPVELVAAYDDREASAELRALLADIADCSALVTVREDSSAGARAPSFAVTSPGQAISLRFAGLPLGHEFTSLVLALLQAGGYPPKVEAAVIEQIQALEGPLHFESFYSQSCHNCPDVVQALNLMAVLNPNISHVAIDGASVVAEMEERQVMSVPFVLLNGQPLGAGRMSVEEILAKVDTGAAKRDAAKLSAKEPFDVLIVGGGNSGVEAAIDLAGIVSHVTLIEFDGRLRADAVLQNKLFSLPNVKVIVSALTTEVKGDGAKVTALVYKDRSSEALHTIELEGIFVQIGLLPNSDFLKGSVELSPRGEVVVDVKGATSLPGVFAAGDVTTTPYKQIVIAMGEGSKAALSAFDHLIRMGVSDEPVLKAA